MGSNGSKCSSGKIVNQRDILSFAVYPSNLTRTSRFFSVLPPCSVHLSAMGKSWECINCPPHCIPGYEYAIRAPKSAVCMIYWIVNKVIFALQGNAVSQCNQDPALILSKTLNFNSFQVGQSSVFVHDLSPFAHCPIIITQFTAQNIYHAVQDII